MRDNEYYPNRKSHKPSKSGIFKVRPAAARLGLLTQKGKNEGYYITLFLTH